MCLNNPISSLRQEPDADEVYPNLFIGNGKSVKTMTYLQVVTYFGSYNQYNYFLQSLGITHVVNAAEGDWIASVEVDREAYEDQGETGKSEDWSNNQIFRC